MMKQINIRNFFTFLLSICIGTTSILAIPTDPKDSVSTEVSIQDYYRITRILGGKKVNDFSVALQEDADTEITIDADAKVSFVVRTASGAENVYDGVKFLRLRVSGSDKAEIEVRSNEITRYSLEIRKR